jgi:hypothetical protein
MASYQTSFVQHSNVDWLFFDEIDKVSAFISFCVFTGGWMFWVIRKVPSDFGEERITEDSISVVMSFP